MKRFSIILLTILLSLTVSTIRGQYSENGFIKQDSMNLSILVLDYLSYEFIEGSISYYPICDSCDLDSLPFEIEFMSPMDYGEILYKYAFNEDTLFYASIWWMGLGEIKIPVGFLSSEAFSYQDESIMLPGHTQYFDYWLTPYGMSMEQYIEKADSAWMSVDSLEIVNEFAEYTFRVGFYAYTPTVGMFDPSVAKWIIFLYYGNTFSTGIREKSGNLPDCRAYPNPFTTSTTIEYELNTVSKIQITIYNSLGEEVFFADEGMMHPGRHTVSWPLSNKVPAGLYYAVLRSEKGVSVVKMIKTD